ncbi:spore protease YyaC [Clostridium polyendosporum]|uniref:Spore protease YyaC n=1 Tax=Clostridium polyendosporum TaxID=69208 RepID=A0A919S063_9CLOT|nr:spore protease YyaC [Clostridium polyendosporum]GIM28843.1 spore protease YyaC [Clostridium polyendosporum]
MFIKDLYKFFIKKNNIMELEQNYRAQDTYTKIVEYFKDDVKNDIVIICIGTNRTDTIDALGPFVGSLLKEDKDFRIPVYGSLVDPIHAKNLTERIREIKNKHLNSTIIAIDACLGCKEDIGKIILKDTYIEAGRGIGKCYAKVGDKCIKCIMAEYGVDVVEYYADLNFISTMAHIIAKGLKEVFK